jgi:F0F1-type ATP synthase membrane subunit b/b'
VKAGLVSHQSEIERLFLDAEAVLQAAKKKFNLAQEQLNELPNFIAEMETEFDARVSHLLHEWTIQREKITVRYRSIQDHKLQHAEDHAKSQSYAYVSDVCIHVLQAYANQHMNSKKHQQLVIDALKNLPAA